MRDALGSLQSVLLVGGTSEIGLATVAALVADRARRVVLAARDLAGAERAAEALRARGARVEILPFDAEEPGREAALAPAFEGEGVDLALVAFGILGSRGDEQLREAARLQAVNAQATVAVLALLAERMRAQGHGVIALLSSIAADRPRPVNFAYGASKAAADLFAQGLRDSLRGSGVDVVIVRPGFVRTKMTRGLKPAPLSVGPEAVAAAVVDALRRRRSVVYVPAGLRWLSLVLRLLPAPVFRRLPL